MLQALIFGKPSVLGIVLFLAGGIAGLLLSMLMPRFNTTAEIHFGVAVGVVGSIAGLVLGNYVTIIWLAR